MQAGPAAVRIAVDTHGTAVVTEAVNAAGAQLQRAEQAVAALAATMDPVVVLAAVMRQS